MPISSILPKSNKQESKEEEQVKLHDQNLNKIESMSNQDIVDLYNKLHDELRKELSLKSSRKSYDELESVNIDNDMAHFLESVHLKELNFSMRQMDQDLHKPPEWTYGLYVEAFNKGYIKPHQGVWHNLVVLNEHEYKQVGSHIIR